MTSRKNYQNSIRQQQIISEARTQRAKLDNTYRLKALKLFSNVCARCGREFSGKKLRELTVHHRDHNHDNNPPDGSNWELLCIYCHDNEHSRIAVSECYTTNANKNEDSSSGGFLPFANLSTLIESKNKK